MQYCIWIMMRLVNGLCTVCIPVPDITEGVRAGTTSSVTISSPLMNSGSSPWRGTSPCLAQQKTCLSSHLHCLHSLDFPTSGGKTRTWYFWEQCTQRLKLAITESQPSFWTWTVTEVYNCKMCTGTYSCKCTSATSWHHSSWPLTTCLWYQSLLDAS